MVFNSIDDIKRYIISRSAVAIKQAQEDVFTILENVLMEFYDEYEPVLYERTLQLLCCCVKEDIKSTGNGWEAEVYFDAGMMNYETGSRPSGEQVLEAASWGRHGAMGLAVADFKGTPIYEESANIISNQIYQKIEKALIEAGIPVHY